MNRRLVKNLGMFGLPILILAALCAAALYRIANPRVMAWIVSDPPGASVYDGNQYVGVTPVAVSFADGEKKELRLVKRGHMDGYVSLDPKDYIQAKKGVNFAHPFRATTYDISVTLKPTAVASLVLTSTPDGAAVFIDGRHAGVTPFIRHDMQPGEYSVRLDHPDCFPLTVPLRLELGQETTLHEELKSRIAKLYKDLIAKDPKEMNHHSDLVHYHVLRGEFPEALEAIREGIAEIARGGTKDTGRFTAEVVHVYQRYYIYPEETETNKILAPLREIVEQAVKDEGEDSKHWQNCLNQMDRYDQTHQPEG